MVNPKFYIVKCYKHDLNCLIVLILCFCSFHGIIFLNITLRKIEYCCDDLTTTKGKEIVWHILLHLLCNIFPLIRSKHLLVKIMYSVRNCPLYSYTHYTHVQVLHTFHTYTYYTLLTGTHITHKSGMYTNFTYFKTYTYNICYTHFTH